MSPSAARPERVRPRRRGRLLLASCSRPSRPSSGPGTPTSPSPSRRSSSCSSRAPASRARSTTSASRWRPPTRSPPPRPASGRGPGHRDRGRRGLLLRRAGQGLGRRARRRAVGDLHRARRRRDARGGRPRSVEPGEDPCAALGAGLRRPLLLTSAWAPAVAERRRHRVPGRRRRRVGHRRPTAVARRRRAAAARELDRHRRRPGRADPRVRSGVGRPLQPGGHAGRPAARRRARPRPRRAPTSPPRSSAACVGAMVANLMFDLPAVELSTDDRAAPARCGSARCVATFGLLLVILGVVRSGRTAAAPFAVGGYIGAPTGSPRRRASPTPPSPSPARSPTRSPGIAPASVPAFVAAQLVGAALAAVGVRPLYLLPDVARPPKDRRRPAQRGPQSRPSADSTHRPVPLRAQRRPLADGARLVQPPRRRPGRRLVGRVASRRPRSTRRRWRRWPRSGIDIAGEFPKRGPTRSSGPPTSSSRWAAATPARSSPASATRTGRSTTPPARSVDAVRPIRDEIGRRRGALLESLGVPLDRRSAP